MPSPMVAYLALYVGHSPTLSCNKHYAPTTGYAAIFFARFERHKSDMARNGWL